MRLNIVTGPAVTKLALGEQVHSVKNVERAGSRLMDRSDDNELMVSNEKMRFTLPDWREQPL